LAARQGRAGAVRILRGSQPGDDRAGPHDGLGLAGVRHDHLPGRVAGRPAGAARGGVHRRREPLELVLAGDLADARPGDAAARGVVDDQRPPAVRRGVLRDPWRAARPNVGRGLLRLPAGLRAGPGEPVARGLRRRHRLRALPGDPAADPGAVLAGPTRRPLLVMNVVAPAPVRPRPDPRSLRGETGVVERPRRRYLPFDPWHLFLAPLAAVMLLPLLWMVVTSLESEAPTLHFPPLHTR